MTPQRLRVSSGAARHAAFTHASLGIPWLPVAVGGPGRLSGRGSALHAGGLGLPASTAMVSQAIARGTPSPPTEHRARNSTKPGHCCL